MPVSLFLIKTSVSHSKIRTEKICLNCGTETPGRYCPACGQENIEPKQSVWHLIHHFFSDITHFDGKFFVTVKDLFAKPGFLSREYMIGRRVSYLDPIRMYIFTSAIFFLIFFSMWNVKNMHFGDQTQTKVSKDSALRKALLYAGNHEDSVRIRNAIDKAGGPVVQVDEDSAHARKGLNVSLAEADYKTVSAYDSAQLKLPESQRDGWLRRRLEKRVIELNIRYEKEHGELLRDMVNNNVHNWPKVLFVSLPIFALLLKLLYIRRKQFYYVDHGIFSIHLYIFSFMILLAFFCVGQLESKTGWGWLEWIIFLLVIYPFFYYYKAMRRFYGQKRMKTLLKYTLLLILSFFTYLIVFIAGILFTVFEV